jgi:RNA polymerase sigma-70 factor (ECF subfamily)
MRSGNVRDDRDDQELMARIQAGDVRAFELLYARYAHPLLNFFYRMCFDRVAAEDYLQETFLRVWRARAGYRPVGKVSTWLFEIAKNFWFNEREKIRRRPFHVAAGGDEAQAQVQLLPDAGDGGSPVGAARAKEVGEALGRAVAELSEKLRAAFVLARYQHLPYAEIAEILEIPVGTVKSRVALAEKLLRARLASYLEE